MKLSELKHALAAFVAALAAQPLVGAIAGGGAFHLTRDLLVSTLVAAAVAAFRKINP